jgi:ABC-type lipoprotein release transport system permease subunit
MLVKVMVRQDNLLIKMSFFNAGLSTSLTGGGLGLYVAKMSSALNRRKSPAIKNTLYNTD